MPGQVAGKDVALDRDRAARRAHRFRLPRQRIPASHGAQSRGNAGIHRQGQAPAALGEGGARLARSRARGADLRPGRPVPGARRIRFTMGASAEKRRSIENPGGIVRTRVKICGITRPADARAAAEAGADAIGLVFYPPSPRFLSVERALEIRDVLPPFVQTVALFVNPDAAQVAQVIGRVKPAMLQFHGEETPGFCAQFGVPWIKAVRVKSEAREVDLLEYVRPFSGAMAWLL